MIVLLIVCDASTFKLAILRSSLRLLIYYRNFKFLHTKLNYRIVINFCNNRHTGGESAFGSSRFESILFSFLSGFIYKARRKVEDIFIKTVRSFTNIYIYISPRFSSLFRSKSLRYFSYARTNNRLWLIEKPFFPTFSRCAHAEFERGKNRG